MTATPPSADDPRDEPPERLQLSVAQVAASSAAAVSAAVVCSLFGVAGTVLGTAAASIVATIGSALYSYSLRRTRARLRRLHQAGAASPPVTAVLTTARGQGTRLFRRVPWRIVLLGTANVFVFAIAFITGLEAILGRPLPAEFGVSHSGSDSTSLGSTLGTDRHRRATPTATPSSTPSRGTAPPTATPVPTGASSAPASPVGSGSPPPTTPTILPSLSLTPRSSGSG